MSLMVDTTHAKLVRDKIKPLEGEQVQTFTGPVLSYLLINKLHEEVEEISRDPTDPLEYADVLELIMTLAEIQGVDWDRVISARSYKLSTKGGFKAGKVLLIRKGSGHARGD